MRAEAARRVCTITHTSEEVVSDCVDYTKLIAWYMEGNTWAPEGPDPREWYDGGGHVRDSYDIALWAAHRAKDVGPEEALVDVVRLGGDADTNAAIAGGLLGAVYGAVWPSRWIDRLEAAGEIFDLASAINEQWEGTS
jgi:ADP-ribosylglycohydrolase